jgi:voltage-gated potassium channel
VDTVEIRKNVGHPDATRNEDDTRRLAWERSTEWPLTVLALLYLGAYAAPILSPNLPSGYRRSAEIIALATWAANAAD